MPVLRQVLQVVMGVLPRPLAVQVCRRWWHLRQVADTVETLSAGGAVEVADAVSETVDTVPTMLRLAKGLGVEAGRLVEGLSDA